MSDQAAKHLQDEDRFVLKDRYTMAELLSLMAFLRSPAGCPWDRQQTARDLRQNMLEEAYEAVAALNSGQTDQIVEELGDVLLQVVFHAQIGQEAGTFTFTDIVSSLCHKLISRHSHLFGSDEAADAAEVLETWDKNKRKEKGQQSQSQVLQDVERFLPALLRSFKVQQKAARVGFDWPDPQGAFQKIAEELAELEQALAGKDQAEVEAELGDLLFALVNYARHLKVEPELALTGATDKFIRRFTAMEDLAGQRGLDLEKMSLAGLDQLWDEVKAGNENEIR